MKLDESVKKEIKEDVKKASKEFLLWIGKLIFNVVIGLIVIKIVFFTNFVLNICVFIFGIIHFIFGIMQ
jgi:hypothetical protein